MSPEDLSFFNRQLAGLLHSGIPLEGALRELGSSMKRGRFRNEIQALEADLANGTPLAEAIAARKFPDVYRTVMTAAAQSRDLPGFLTVIADYYHRAGDLSRRLQGLLVYPFIVLLCSLALAAWMAQTQAALTASSRYPSIDFGVAGWHSQPTWHPASQRIGFWLPPLTVILLVVSFAAAVTIPPIRRFLEWRLPAFKDARLAQFAESMALLLHSGVPLPDSIALLKAGQHSTAAGRDLDRWQHRLAEGHAHFQDLARGGRTFPPLFVWLVAGEGKDVAAGFSRAAEIYRQRAIYRSELLLQAALPTLILMLGVMIMLQIFPWMTTLQDRLSELMSIFRITNIIGKR